MSAFARWMKFNAVGGLGMGVQLAALAGFHRLLGGHYLLATGAALEVTLLHNFVWHQRVTFCDCRSALPAWQALLRFHVANGLVSLVGNLVLMRALVDGAHWPLLGANAAAIACCSVANFMVGARWVFPALPAGRKMRIATMKARLLLLFIVWMGGHARAQAQGSPEPGAAAAPVGLPRAAEPLPTAPQAVLQKPGDSYLYHLAALCGVGASTSSVATKPAFGCGVGGTLVPYPIFVEVGVMGPQANRSYVSGYISIDANIRLAPLRSKVSPQVLFGYSRLFETGHAIDYGVALALPRWWTVKDGKSLRLELRDYWTFANPQQHNVMLRIGLMIAEYGD